MMKEGQSNDSNILNKLKESNQLTNSEISNLNITIDENANGPRALFSIEVKNVQLEVDCPKDISALNLLDAINEKIFANKETKTPITITDVMIIEDNSILKKYKEELECDDDLTNYAEKLSTEDPADNELVQKIKLNCNYEKEDSSQKNKELKIIILNDKDIEKPKNYIKENHKFKKYENYKNLVDKLVLSRKDVDEKKYQHLNHDLEEYNLYAEILDDFNCLTIEENEKDNIRNSFAEKSDNIDNEINMFIDLCFSLIVEYLKFELIKEVKFNQCQNCGSKCVYILFSQHQQKIVAERQLEKDELKKGINVVRNIFNIDSLCMSKSVIDDKRIVTNIIYLNDEVNKNVIKLIENNATGTVLYIKNINQLELLMQEVNEKNKKYGINYKFLSICTGKLIDNLIEFLKKDKIYRDIIDNVVIYCENKQEYENLENDYNFIDEVIDNEKSLEEYIKNYKDNSKIYETITIINYESYMKKYNEIHKEIAKYYGKVAFKFKNAINIFKDFLNEYEGELKINTSSKKRKKKILLKTLEVFNTDDETEKIKLYTKEKNSYYNDFNYWLNNINKKAISKIAYFVGSLMFSLNNVNKGLEKEAILYRGICIDYSNIIKYYMNYINDDKIIIFPSFTSTSTSEEISKSFASGDNYGVLFKINYNYTHKEWKYLAVNISSFSDFSNEEECLFLPFTFYKIKNFEFDKENKLAKIELDCIFKKEILENNLNEKNNIVYNKEENIMEIDNKIVSEEEGFLINDNEKYNEITLKIECKNENKTIYFINNTDGKFSEKEENKIVENKLENLSELNENNTVLIIDGEIVPFKKSFIPTKIGIHSIKLIFKSELTNCANMFYNCKEIIDINFSKFNAENVTDIKGMFDGCSSLLTLDMSSFNAPKITSMSCMFKNLSSLKSLELSSFNTQNVIDMGYMFFKCSSLTSLNLSSFNTQNVTKMSYMFSDCSSLTSINLSSFNTQNVTNMGCMFDICKCLTSLDLSSFNTKNVRNMGYMFRDCKSLTSLDLSSFNTEKVRYMYFMFYGCSGLKSLDLKSFNTQNVTTMAQMFYNCSSLTSLDLSSFKTEKVTDMYGMFYSCSSLTSLDLRSLNASNAYTGSMFFECNMLTEFSCSDANILEMHLEES